MLRERGQGGKEEGEKQLSWEAAQPQPQDLWHTFCKCAHQRGNIFIPWSHFSCPNKPARVRELRVVRREACGGGGWGLLRRVGKGQRGGQGEESTGRQQSRSERQNPSSCHPGPEHSPIILGHARWTVGARVRTQAGISCVCHFRTWSVEGWCWKGFCLSPLPLFSCPATTWICVWMVIQTNRFL